MQVVTSLNIYISLLSCKSRILFLTITIIINTSLGDNLNPTDGFTISVLKFSVSIGSMSLIILVTVAVCLVAMTVVLIRMKRATQAAELHEMETTGMESGTYDDIIRIESHTIETECNEAYNYVMKHQAF